MRGGRYLVTLAAAGMLAAGCGTVVAGRQPAPDALAAAVTRTGTQSVRIAMTTGMQAQGMSVSFTATGEFDFAHSRGLLTMPSPIPMTELFLAPKAYLKFSGGNGADMGLPHGKSWLEVDGGFPSANLGAFGPFGVSGNPADLLASLRAIAGSERDLGHGTVRGVPVTEFQVNIDPAKAAAKVPAWERASFQHFAQSLGRGAIPVDVWVDAQDQVRRVRLSLHMPGGAGSAGMPASTRMVESIDFYDFGVPVRVSAPPASEVASMGQFIASGVSSGSSGMNFAIAPPPTVKGSLTPAQAAAAEQAVTALWTALGHDDPAAAARAVLPAQRSCISSMMQSARLKITVKSLRIVSAQPDGTGKATVRFTVRATASLDGQQVPVSPETSGGSVQWLVATQSGGHWYVDASTGSDGGDGGEFVTGGPCS